MVNTENKLCVYKRCMFVFKFEFGGKAWLLIILTSFIAKLFDSKLSKYIGLIESEDFYISCAGGWDTT